MYDYLGIAFQPIRLIWVYTKTSATAQHPGHAPTAEDADAMPGSYFVYGRRLHEMLLLSPSFWGSSFKQILQTFYLAVCHLWFFAACLLLQPLASSPSENSAAAKRLHNCESFGEYLERIRLPRQYVTYYLLPVLSVICSCSHAEMMDFPASDVTAFMMGSFLQRTYVSRGGINKVQSMLSKGIQNIRLNTRVTKVQRVDEGVLVCWESRKGEKVTTSEEIFDRVVLAVSPNVAAAIFIPSKALLSAIPTVPVTTSITAPPSAGISLKHETGPVPSGECSYHSGRPQVMEFRTTFSDKSARSESFHFLPSGMVVRSSPCDLTAESKGKLKVSKFTRTLRTTQSRSTVQRIMRIDKPAYNSELQWENGAGTETWVNGKDNVWITGSWCWDGLVLLEGCVVSAMKVARDFGVSVPWDEE